MKLIYPEVNSIISIKQDMFNSLVIENQSLLYKFIMDIHQQMEKRDGKVVLSQNNELLDICKNVELMTDVYGFCLNSKSILGKITDILCQKAVDEVHYEQSMRLISDIEAYFDDLVWDMDCEIVCNDINVKQLIKSISFEVVDDKEFLAERILRYMEMVRMFLGDKLFLFVNFRGFIEESQFQRLTDTMIQHEYHALFIDNKEFAMLENENRLTIDVDLCEF